MTGHEGKQVTGSVQYCAVNKSHSGKASMTTDEGKQVIGSVQCCGVERFHEGKPSVIVQRQLQVNDMFGSAKARLFARPGIWHCTVSKHPGNK